MLLMLAPFANAGAVTLDFEGVVADDAAMNLDPDYRENGFIVDATGSLALISGKDYWGDHDSASMNWCGIYDQLASLDCIGDSITLSHEDSVFSLQSFVVGAIHQQSGAELIIILNGQTASGDVLRADIGFVSGQTITMDSAWANMESVSFSAESTNFHCCIQSFNPFIDDIVVTAVPVPAAVWLFGSALAGLGWFRRKTA
jgi:hypothetical protein